MSNLNLSTLAAQTPIGELIDAYFELDFSPVREWTTGNNGQSYERIRRGPEEGSENWKIVEEYQARKEEVDAEQNRRHAARMVAFRQEYKATIDGLNTDGWVVNPDNYDMTRGSETLQINGSYYVDGRARAHNMGAADMQHVLSRTL